jgi:hypothetical protein
MLPSNWPKWSLILIALGMVIAVIVGGLIFEPLGQALSPASTPIPTLAAINYARPLSGECESCHFDKQALAASAASAIDAETYYIDPASLETPHGSLGCVTCHEGTGNVAEKDAAHVGLIDDLSETHPEDCLLCHRDLPEQIPEDHLRTPHGLIRDAVWEGSACGVLCSDCHGQVGHGFDPVTGDIICPMSVCLDCHVERNLDAQLNDCNTCHVGPHDVSLALTCKDCHTSTDTWREVELAVHPVELTGYHAVTDCFSCHDWPNFRNLDYVCSDCHSRPHEFGNDDCALCHTPDGWAESAEALVAGASPFPHPALGREECRSCHEVGGTQAIPEDHKGRTNVTCQVCHEAAPAPAILHPVEGHDACLDCHGEGQVAQLTLAVHAGRDETTCQTCHEVGGVMPLPILHSLDGRADCVVCHGSTAFQPYPESHEGWGNDLCLLCHEAGGLPTEGEHRFPQDHNATAGNCVFCHPGNDFDTYHCETCHAMSGMSQIHEARGITKIEGKCALCHPQGLKP